MERRKLVNQKGERERFFGSNFWRRMQWRGRLDMDPKPTMAHDPAIGYTEQWGPLHDPNDLKGAGVLNFRYVSPDVPDDSYLYLPELRKVRRLSMANRSDAFWGTDIDIDSIWTWNSKLSFWTFKYLGTHPQLGALHSGGYAQREALCAQPDGTSGIKSFFWCLPTRCATRPIVEGTPSGSASTPSPSAFCTSTKSRYWPSSTRATTRAASCGGAGTWLHDAGTVAERDR